VPEIHPSRLRDLQRCLQQLGLPTGTTVQWERLDQALTHKSADPTYNYESLEFLGDAVLRLGATECLQGMYPQASVGELSALRSVLISDRTLGQLADQLGLGNYVIMANPAKPGARVMADALEAVVAALYQETHSLALVRPWLDPHLQRLATEVRQDPTRQNYKVAVQELTQAHARTLPEYRITEARAKEDGSHTYQAEVWFQGRCWGRGQASTKKQAEQAAAAAAYGDLIQHVKPHDPAAAAC